MKLEKINDNQIRCTLNKADLVKRELRLSELAYGSDKAKALFRDMMQRASAELGFEADNIPLMIEAIPISNDCLVLVVTKVEDPDELDTRFSRFTRSASDMDTDDDYDGYEDDRIDFDEDDLTEEDFSDEDDEEVISFSSTADLDHSDSSEGRSAVDEALDLIAPFTQAIAQAKREAMKKSREKNNSSVRQYYLFRDFTQAAKLGTFLQPFYEGESALYKNPSSGQYYLILTKGHCTSDTFRRACNLASDFGVKITASYATPSYFNEHFDVILKDNALETLSELA